MTEWLERVFTEASRLPEKELSKAKSLRAALH